MPKPMPVQSGGGSGSGGSGSSPGGPAGSMQASPQVALLHRTGIDPGAVGQLVTAMNKAVGAFGSASQAIGRIAERANQAVLSSLPPGLAHAFTNGMGATASPPPDGGKLQALIQQVPPVATEVNKRLTHFLACERDIHVALGTHGPLTIDPSLWFTDEPPPDPAKISSAISQVARVLDGRNDPYVLRFLTDRGEAQEILGYLKQFNATEADAVLNGLTPGQLNSLNNLVGGSNDTGLQQQYTTFILSTAGPATVARLRPHLNSLQLSTAVGPDSNWGGAGTTSWQPADEPLFGPGGPNPYTDVEETYTGDCVFLSTLAAVAHRSPGWIESHIHQDPNGNYTVVLYKNGQPVDVTVTPGLPFSSANGQELGANTDRGDEWVAIYEKAWAQFAGGYGAIDATGSGTGTLAQRTFMAITGQQRTTALSWGPGSGSASTPPSLPDIQSLLSRRQVLTAYSPADGTDSLGENILGSHEYWINRVYTDPATHQQMIEMVNPWGPDGNPRAPEYLHLTQAEFQKFFRAVDGMPPPGTPPPKSGSGGVIGAVRTAMDDGLRDLGL